MRKHPDADAFVRAYLAQPADATTRLVFADWLEDTGVPHNRAWANFIRLRDEASHYAPASDEWFALRRRSDECAREIRARLTISAKRFVTCWKSLLQLLPAANITVRLANFEISPDKSAYLRGSIARANLICPFDIQDQTLLIAAAPPADANLPHALEFTLNRSVVLVYADQDEVLSAINRCYIQTEPETLDSVPLDTSQPPLDLQWPSNLRTRALPPCPW